MSSAKLMAIGKVGLIALGAYALANRLITMYPTARRLLVGPSA